MKKPLSLSVAGSSPRALPRMSDSNLPVVPSSRFWVWARMRSANSTTDRCARSPKVTMRDRSEMSISDLIRATADASTMTAGTLMASLIALPLLCAHSRHMVPRLCFGKIAQPAKRIDEGGTAFQPIGLAGNLPSTSIGYRFVGVRSAKVHG